MTKHATQSDNEAPKSAPLPPDTQAHEVPAARAFDALDAPAQAQAPATPGAGGVRATGGGRSSLIHSDAEDFAQKATSPDAQKKKSRGAPPAVASVEAVACAPRASGEPPRGEPAAEAESPANRVSSAEVSAARTLSVFRLCKNDRLVLAKLDPRDPQEAPKTLRVMRRGVLRVGMRVSGVPVSPDQWRQVHPQK